jgi:serine protease AprX
MRYSIRKGTADQVRQAGGQNVRETRVAIFATLTEEQAEKLRRQGCIVEKVEEVSPTVLPPPPLAARPVYSPYQLLYAAGLNQIREMTVPRLYGEGFNVALVGSGIRETHEMVGGRVVYRQNYTAEPHEDRFDHETGVASIIVAVAPRCNLLDMKVLDEKGHGTSEEVVLAIDDLISMHEAGSEFSPHVINLSLGGPDTGNPDDPLRAICREALSRGIFVFASAGNGGPNPETIMSPATEPYVFAVGSVDPIPGDNRIVGFAISQFSSRGPTREGVVKPDGIFFGADIVMASSAGDTATVAKSGTSFAAPFASGAAVIFLNGEVIWGGQRPPAWWFMASPLQVPYPMTPQGLVDVFMPLVSVKPTGAAPGKDNDYGWGMPYGALVMERFGVRAAVTSLLQPVLLMGVVGMLGMMTATITRGMR